MLWYLHLCAASGVVVEEYVDDAHGTMMEDRATGGRFTEVVLQPTVTISSGNPALAESLHEKAHHFCYVANSVNFPVRCKPTIRSTA
jgi:organic hydroperoxide reductase OsmC/OhrA